MPLVRPRDRDGAIGDIQNWITGNEGRGVPVVAKTEVNHVERRRKLSAVLDGCGVEIRCFDRHRMNDGGHAIEKGLGEAGEVSRRISGGGDALVHLIDIDPSPVERHLCEQAKDRTGGATARDRKRDPLSPCEAFLDRPSQGTRASVDEVRAGANYTHALCSAGVTS
jgi:hypothetical protein